MSISDRKLVEGKHLSQAELEDLVIESDSGARAPTSKLAANVLMGTALLWSLFQLWIASPFQFQFVEFLKSHGISFWGILNDTETRSVHLAFAVFLAFMAYPAFKSSPRSYIPIADIIMGLLAAFCASYIYIFYEQLSGRAGIPTTIDIAVSCLGLVLLLEATRRSLGPPLLVISVIFIVYTIFGNMSFVPELIRWKGASITKIANHQWLTTEGVFGVALSVSTSFVFLFVLFGALLDKAGAGNYFIKVAFSLLGHMRGGPAKAAVLSSAMTGLISGSSIANTVTTGTFTIPLMKRVGFSAEKAGAIEVASSVNGQIMPPVMGAAAFLMVEYIDLPYIEIVKHAFLPALISYIALLYIVHLEAVKSGIKPLPKAINRSFLQGVVMWGIVISSIIIFSYLSYNVIKWIKIYFGNGIINLGVFEIGTATLVFSSMIAAAYIALVRYSCCVDELEKDDPNSEMIKLPKTAPTVKSGVHYLLPIVVLVWCLMVERLSPGLSAFWATFLMIFIIATQDVLKAFFRKTGKYNEQVSIGANKLLDGLVTGARNMIGIGVATAAAGIIVGSVSLTGIGQVLTEVIEAIAGDSMFFILLLTALICLVLGMGLPTTANYIVVATLMAHVVQELGARNGLFVPLIAIHLFVFYFGIMADVTPPVGLASFAAAAISGADPIKTGIQAFSYSLRTAILPFFFIYDPELIMVGVDSIWHGIWVFFYATGGILIFSAAMQGYFLTWNKFYETIILLVVSITIFIPGLWIDFFFHSYRKVEEKNIEEVIKNYPAGSTLMIRARGENKNGKIIEVDSYVPIIEGGVDATLKNYGIIELEKHKTGTIYDVDFNSIAFKTGIEFDFSITKIKVPHEQPNKRFVYIPVVLLLGFVIMSQRLRKRREAVLQQV